MRIEFARVLGLRHIGAAGQPGDDGIVGLFELAEQIVDRAHRVRHVLVGLFLHLGDRRRAGVERRCEILRRRNNALRRRRAAWRRFVGRQSALQVADHRRRRIAVLLSAACRGRGRAVVNRLSQRRQPRGDRALRRRLRGRGVELVEQRRIGLAGDRNDFRAAVGCRDLIRDLANVTGRVDVRYVVGDHRRLRARRREGGVDDRER